MAHEIVVPRLGVTVKEVTVIEWLVGDGGAVTQGQAIVLVESDKTEMELEATVSGTLEHAADPQDVLQVGEVIGKIF